MSDHLQVEIKPLQAAYFAGETFCVHITFRNLHPLQPVQVLGRNASYTDKTRHYTSLSHAAPSTPTSAPPEYLAPRQTYREGNIRTPLSASFAALPESVKASSRLPTRKGLIGTGADLVATARRNAQDTLVHGSGNGNGHGNESLYPTKRLPSTNLAHQKNKLSVAIGPGTGNRAELTDFGAQQAAIKYQQQNACSQDYVPSSKRTHLLRSQSNSILSPTGEEGPYPFSGSPIATHASSPIRSPLDQDNPPYLHDHDEVLTQRSSFDFYGLGTNESMDSVLRDQLSALTRSGYRRSASTSLPQTSHTRFASTGLFSRFNPLNSSRPTPPWEQPREQYTILWAFAQLSGSFQVDETLIKPAEFVAVKRSLFGQPGTEAPSSQGSYFPTHRTGLVGGGSLDAPPSSSEKSGWTDWLWSSTPGISTSSGQDGYSSAGKSTLTSVVGGATGGGTLADRRSRAMSDKSIPIFSIPPSVFAIDLVLEPGQTKTFSYTLRLPGDLPPSFKGRSIRFSYSLIVGTHRAPSTALGETQQRSRVLHLPVRIFNNVSESGARPFYDLTNPIVWFKDEAETAVVSQDADMGSGLSTGGKQMTQDQGGKHEFECYATDLLDSVKLPSHAVLSPSSTPMQGGDAFSDQLLDPNNRPEMHSRTSMPHAELTRGEDLTGCVAAIESVSRTAPKASFDINKDGYTIASVVFAKSAYRLGETIYVSVLLNTGDARVLKVAGRLETHEQVETSISLKKAGQVRSLTRRVHAEHVEIAFDSARMTMALDIPSGATPDFATSGVKLQWSVKLAFHIKPPVISDAISPKPSAAARPSQRRFSSDLTSLHRLKNPHHRSQSFAFGATQEPDVAAAQSGTTHHIMPVPDASTLYLASYKAVPDLSFSPVLFQSEASSSKHHGRSTSYPIAPAPIAETGGTERPHVGVEESVVLVPSQTEVVECSIPIKVYPASTPFLPASGIFYA